MKCIFTGGGRFDGKILDVIESEENPGKPVSRSEYIDHQDEDCTFHIGIYELADRWTGDTPVFVFKGIK